MAHQTISISRKPQQAKINTIDSELLADLEKSLDDIRHGRVIRVR